MSGPIEISNGRETVKIYSTIVRRKPLFQVAYYRAGKRLRQNFANLREARAQAKIILAQLASSSAQVAEAVTTPELESLVAARKALDGIDCPLHIAVEGFSKAVQTLGTSESPVTNLIEAAAFYRKHHPAAVQRAPLTDLTARFVESRRRRGLSDSYVSSCDLALGELLKAFKGSAFELPSADDVMTWLEKKYKNPVTRNTHLRVLKTFALWAKKHHYIPIDTISNIDLWKQPPGAVEIYTPDEMRAILAGIPKTIVPAVAINGFAGLRASEVRKLDWSEINFDRGFITISAENAKTATRRLTPIQDNLKQWLAPYAKSSGPVAPYGRCYVNDTIRERKLPSKRNALRHSYISYRLALMPDAPRVALECGNSPRNDFPALPGTRHAGRSQCMVFNRSVVRNNPQIRKARG